MLSHKHRLEIPDSCKSLWIGTTENTDYPRLTDDLDIDVAVVGGGITGLTTAYLLKRAGKKVAVLEGGRIACGASGNTTAKIALSHGVVYDYLLKQFGERHARAYVNANSTGLDTIAGIVSGNGIDCDFERADSYIYSTGPEDRAELEKEAEAARKLGLEVDTVSELPLPVKAAAGIRYANQAQFHPRKYLLALAEFIHGDGSYIFEETRVTDVTDGKHCLVEAGRYQVKAGKVVVASHFPVYDPGLFFARITQMRSYLLAAQLNGEVPADMYYSTEESFHSFRRYEAGGKQFLLIGGQHHSTGHGGDTRERYKALADYAADHFDIASVDFKWSTQDNFTVDRVPYIGKPVPGILNVFVATGYKGWGMTGATAAAVLLNDLVCRGEADWEMLFTPTRLKAPVTSVKKATAQTLKATIDFLAGRLTPSKEPEVASLERGQGRIIEVDTRKLGVYRDMQGHIHAVQPECPHMGCIVEWNSAEKSWDCPCHGSRYEWDGTVINSPTVKPLKKIDLE